MAAGSLLALLDDIASVLDDVAVLSKLAARKTAGVLGDDLALNAQQVSGVRANRELPVVWAVAKGSFVNKAILVPLALFESGAILIYLAEKSGRFLPADAAGRYEAIQWLMFQMGGVGPMFGQLGFFHKFAGKDYEDKRPRDRYVAESVRLLRVLDGHLQGRDWMLGRDYSIADIAIFPWVRNLVGFYEAREMVQFDRFAQVQRVLDAFVARPAVQRGLAVPAAG